MSSPSSKTMLSLRLTRSDPTTPPTLTLETLPLPIPLPGQLLIRVHASPLHPSDLINRLGKFPQTTYPRTPGRDFSGLVISPSSSPLYQKPVFGTSGNTQAFSLDGAHAEYILVSEDAVAEKPQSLSWVQAAVVGVPFTTAWLVLKRAGVVGGERVLVFGANGAVGSAVVQLATARGCVVFRGQRGGGDVDTGADPELAAVSGLTDGKGVDVVVDTVGQPGLTAAGIRVLGRGGRLVFIAAPKTGSTELGVEMMGFYRAEKSLVGVNSLVYGVEEMAKILSEVGGLFEEGKLVGAKEGDWSEVALKDGVEGYERAAQRGAGKVVLVMG